MAFLFAGYTVGGYGWVLLRGYNVPFTNWVSPLHPYTGAFSPGTIPDTVVYPPGPGGVEGTVPGGAGPLRNPGPAKGGTQAA